MPAAGTGPGAREPGSPLRARLAGEAASHPCGEQGLPGLASPPLKPARDWVLRDLRSVRGCPSRPGCWPVLGEQDRPGIQLGSRTGVGALGNHS